MPAHARLAVVKKMMTQDQFKDLHPRVGARGVLHLQRIGGAHSSTIKSELNVPSQHIVGSPSRARDGTMQERVNTCPPDSTTPADFNGNEVRWTPEEQTQVWYEAEHEQYVSDDTLSDFHR